MTKDHTPLHTCTQNLHPGTTATTMPKRKTTGHQSKVKSKVKDKPQRSPARLPARQLLQSQSPGLKKPLQKERDRDTETENAKKKNGNIDAGKGGNHPAENRDTKQAAQKGTGARDAEQSVCIFYNCVPLVASLFEYYFY